MGSGQPHGFFRSLFRLPIRETHYLWIIIGMFTMCLVLSNILSTAKLIEATSSFELAGFVIPAFILSGGTTLFPVMYVFSDILTEIYGYKVCRKVIWLGFFCIFIATGFIFFVNILPGAPFWKNQAAYEAILMNVWRINIASFMAYWVGEFLNSYVLAKMKLREVEGKSNKRMGKRFICSTLVGQFADTAIFSTVAFAGVVSNKELIAMILFTWIFKVVWELVSLPATVPLVRKLKEAEGIDVFDRDTDFNPIKLQD